MIHTITPITDFLGYEVQGIDLSKELTPHTQTFLKAAMHSRGLLLFREQDLSDSDQLRFAHVFGRISRQGPVQRSGTDITYVSNVRVDGTFGAGELNFHSDQSYFEHPMKSIMLFGIEIPHAGGETLFSNTAVALARMPSALREVLERNQVFNEMDYGRLTYGGKTKAGLQSVKRSATHPAIRLHDKTGVPVLMVDGDNTQHLVGPDFDQSQTVLQAVRDCVSDKAIVYRHKWKPRDLIVWDNQLLQHARSNFDPQARRTLRRCAIAHDLEAIV